MSKTYDIVVIGAGLMGSSAAHFASTVGKRVLLLEQFEFLHGCGSSHGQSRIFRVGYPDTVYTKLSQQSLTMWHKIEQEANVKLIEMTGELDFASERNAALEGLEETLKTHNVPFEVLTGAEANARFRGFSLPATSHAVFNPVAGVLNPTLAMQTLQTLAKKNGADARDHSKVTKITVNGENDDVVVTLEDGESFHAHQCIITAGPWTKQLVDSNTSTKMKLQPIATFGTYWRCKEELYTPDKFPVFISYEAPEVYGLPMMDPREGVKICAHHGPPVDPDARVGVEQPGTDVAHLTAFVEKNFSHVDASSGPNQVDHCMYTMTTDDNFIIDFLPLPTAGSSNTKKVVVGAGFSGHGAKMTPVIGQILADLAIKGETSYPIDLFRLTRPEVVDS